jgi:hypothetical protein
MEESISLNKMDQEYFQQIKKTGMDGDAHNAWSHLDPIHILYSHDGISLEEFLEKLAKPIKTYDEYIIENNSPERASERLGMSDPEARRLANELTNEYNSLPGEEKAKFETLESFFHRKNLIFNEGIDPEKVK